jgi:hypothetical protein
LHIAAGELGLACVPIESSSGRWLESASLKNHSSIHIADRAPRKRDTHQATFDVTTDVRAYNRIVPWQQPVSNRLTLRYVATRKNKLGGWVIGMVFLLTSKVSR